MPSILCEGSVSRAADHSWRGGGPGARCQTYRPARVPVLILLALCEVVLNRQVKDERMAALAKAKPAARLAVALVSTGIIAVGVLWAFYGFRYGARPAGLQLKSILSRLHSTTETARS